MRAMAISRDGYNIHRRNFLWQGQDFPRYQRWYNIQITPALKSTPHFLFFFDVFFLPHPPFPLRAESSQRKSLAFAVNALTLLAPAASLPPCSVCARVAATTFLAFRFDHAHKSPTARA